MNYKLIKEKKMINRKENGASVQHVFIIGSKSIGQYGGYETFVYRLICEHENEPTIKYHIACKANGDGSMDETKLSEISIMKKNDDGIISEFEYKNAHVFKIPCPNIGPAVAIYYDRAAIEYSIQYCKDNHIEHPIFYILTCRIGLFISLLSRQIKAIGGKYYLNPDGHEWKRAKWSVPIRKYWKWSEKMMVKYADLVICDSINIEKYIQSEYDIDHTIYIAYGADVKPSSIADDDAQFIDWLNKNELKTKEYYMCCGRFVPENSFEIMIGEFLRSRSSRDFVIITTRNDVLMEELESKLHWKSDKRIKFVGTVYNPELLKKIRENAYGNFHGHTVGGTNPSLLEALGATDLNFLIDVCFNKEVAKDSALYWNADNGSLTRLIDEADKMSESERAEYGRKAKNRIQSAYSWHFIGNEYKKLWNNKMLTKASEK